MHMVDIIHFGYGLQDNPFHFIRLKVIRRSLHQNVTRSPHQMPSTAQNEQRYDHRENRVYGCPSGEVDYDRCHNGGDRAEHIANHMQQRPLNIQVLLMPAMQDSKGDDIDQQSNDGDSHHDTAEHFNRVIQTLNCFDTYPDHDADQSNAVHECGKHRKTVISVGALHVRRSPGYTKREPCQSQSSSIGKHVSGIGKQRQRAGDYPTNDLDDHETDGQEHGTCNAPFVIDGNRSMGMTSVVVVGTTRVVGVLRMVG